MRGRGERAGEHHHTRNMFSCRSTSHSESQVLCTTRKGVVVGLVLMTKQVIVVVALMKSANKKKNEHFLPSLEWFPLVLS